MLKSTQFKFTICIIFCFFFTAHAFAEDMRADHIEQSKQKELILQKAKMEEKNAKEEARKNDQRIRSDRDALKMAIRKLKKHNKKLEDSNKNYEIKIKELKEKEKNLSEDLSELNAIINELSGLIRGNAKDLDALLVQSPQSALIKTNRTDFLKPMINQSKFPSMDDIFLMVDTLFDEIQKSGEVKLTKGMIIDRQGHETMADLLIIGNFTAMYSLGNETGFLLYSDQSNRFFALSRLPSNRMTKKNTEYMSGICDDVFMDISKGAAIRQLTHQLSLIEQIPKGGPIVWPIIALLGLALLIVLERLIFLMFKSMNVNAFMKKLELFIQQKNWDECKKLLESKKRKIIPKVLLAAIDFRNRNRQDMENALQEAILREIPSLERFLSTLGMLAAIAPLLGLLGTVTGMINTFHVITYYGTGDPRMMSGGISEALVTTMLGLSVAIPIMLVHTLLSRKVETMISKMEEKSVAFVNLVFKAKIIDKSGEKS